MDGHCGETTAERIHRERQAKPGSDAAIQRGCSCPVMDNAHGAGRNGSFIMSADCPLHGKL